MSKRRPDLVWDARDYSQAVRAYLEINAVTRNTTVDQESFGFGDPGTEAGHTLDSQNADRTVQEDGNGNYKFFLRWLLVQTTTNANANLTNTFKLQYRKNAGTWTDVTASSSNVRVVDDTNITDGAATTSRLTAGTGTPIPGWYDEGDGVWPALTWDPATNNREEANFLSSLEVVDADVVADDVLDFRVLHSSGTLLSAYTVADATLTWQAAAAAPQTVTPTPVTAGFSTPTPGLTLGALTLSPDAVTATLGVPAPAAQLGALTVSPDAVSAAWAVAAPSLNIGAVTLTPDSVAAALAVASPSRSVGPLTVSPDPATAAWGVPAPSMGGEQMMSPDPATGAWSVPAPSLMLGELALAPSPVAAAWAVASPSLVTGPVTLAPDPVQAAWGVFTPSFGGGGGGGTPLYLRVRRLYRRRASVVT